jgi:hypothetical protein
MSEKDGSVKRIGENSNNRASEIVAKSFPNINDETLLITNQQ